MIKVPKYILKNQGVRTAREWRSKKRYEARVLERALKIFRFGCYYSPAGYRLIEKATKAIQEIRESLKVKNWK